MLWLERLCNLLRRRRLDRDLAEEMASHLDEAVARGRSPVEARRAFGNELLYREQSRDGKLLPWLDSLLSDALFGCRQLRKRPAATAAAVLSLALAIGSCTSAFRLIDGLLFRPLPVASPQQLYILTRHGIGPEGKPQIAEEWAYPAYRQMRDAVAGQAELLAIGPSERTDVTYRSGNETEKAYVQFVSGSMFTCFGLRPAAGRLLTSMDDQTPGAHPVAVITSDYWTRRFGRSAAALGRAIRVGEIGYQIVGVIDGPFTGTETGTPADLFVPAMMHPFVTRDDATWMRAIARIPPGTAVEPLRQRLTAISRSFDENRARSFVVALPKAALQHFLDQTLTIESASAGVSGMQRNLRLPLAALGVLVALVLLIACANVANLMTAQAAARAREMALRISIGAGRGRLVQLVLVESFLVAVLAAAAGSILTAWSTPFVLARINPPDNPARLPLAADWRVLTFGLGVTLAVVLLFGLAPALRAATLRPAIALKGGDNPHSRRRLMHTLIAVQAAFCFIALFGATLFVGTFQRLANQPTGFSADRVLTLDTLAAHPLPPFAWDQAADRLRAMPGVQTVALADWPLLSGNSRNNFITVTGRPPGPDLTYFRYTSPGWLDALRIPLLAGRDFRNSDTSPGAAIVNQTFANMYFGGENPLGRTFERTGPWKRKTPMTYQVVGVVADLRYRNMREPILPVAFVPLHAAASDGALMPISEAVFVVRTAAPNPLAMASLLRQEVQRAQPDLRVADLQTQAEINARHTVRERLLAMVASFFGVVALLLAAIGLYGVLDYSVLQRRREIGIRVAIGARPAEIARQVTAQALSMLVGGAFTGLVLGLILARYIAALFYHVKATDLAMLALPAVTILAAAFAAAVPAVARAVRIDPAATLRSE